MIVEERMVTYMNSLDRGNTPFLNELEQEAIQNRVPIIRREMQSFLKVLLQIKAPKRILEVGTAVGFSTLLMSTYNPVKCEIVTIENYEKRIPIARKNFQKSGKEWESGDTFWKISLAGRMFLPVYPKRFGNTGSGGVCGAYCIFG